MTKKLRVLNSGIASAIELNLRVRISEAELELVKIRKENNDLRHHLMLCDSAMLELREPDHQISALRSANILLKKEKMELKKCIAKLKRIL